MDPTGHAGEQIGHVYVIRGIDPATSQPVSYTGSTIQELKKRFGSHKWRELIKAPTTTIEVQPVTAEVDVAASGRGTLRSAKIEAVRAPEEAARQRVAKEPARPLNEVAAATDDNAQAWKQRHNVKVGKSYAYKGPGGSPAGAGATSSTVSEAGMQATVAESAGASGAAGRSGPRPKVGGVAGAFIALAVYDVFQAYREEKVSRYVSADIILEDEGGSFVVQCEESLFSARYEKRYIEGDRFGTAVPIDKSEFNQLKEEAEALYGYADWKGDFVPGKLRKELPVIEVSPADGGA